MELKQRMTFDEMKSHLEVNSTRVASRVTVGLHAKKLGYKVYKPMIKGIIHFFYVKESI